MSGARSSLQCQRGAPTPPETRLSLPVAGPHGGLIVRLGPDSERSLRRALRGSDTARDLLAAPTICGRKLHLHDGMPTTIQGWCPTTTALADRTDRVVLVPMDLEMLGVQAGP